MILISPDLDEKENGSYVLDIQEEYMFNLSFTSSTKAPNGTFYIYAIATKDNTSSLILINAKTTNEFTQKKQTFEETKLRLNGLVKEVKEEYSQDAKFAEILKNIKVRLYTKIFDGNDQVIVCRQMEIRLKGEDPDVEKAGTSTPVEIHEKATGNVTTTSSS